MKRFRSWDKGEADREWLGLTLLRRHAPDLAPEPLERRTEDGRPVVVMSYLPGEPLGGRRLSGAQLAGLADALQRLHEAVPARELSSLPERQAGPVVMQAHVLSRVHQPHQPVEAVVGSALEAARGWVASEPADSFRRPIAEPVFAHADGNIANLLWDGARCRVVDFEDCGTSDRAYEVADLVEHVAASLGGLIDVAALTTLLDFSPDQNRRLLRCRRLMAVFWLLMLLPGNPGHARNPQGSLVRQAERVLGLL